MSGTGGDFDERLRAARAIRPMVVALAVSLAPAPGDQGAHGMAGVAPLHDLALHDLLPFPALLAGVVPVGREPD